MVNRNYSQAFSDLLIKLEPANLELGTGSRKLFLALKLRSYFTVVIFLKLYSFLFRARVKSGLRVLGAECSDKESWNTSLDVNPKHTVATVTAFRRSFDTDMAEKRVVPRVEEVFTWLLEVVEDSADLWDEGRLVWSVRYVREGQERGRGNSHHRNAPGTTSPSQEERKKITARLEIQKDDIQAVLPISKNWEVINTAVLTGRQVSQAMKVFIVSQAGKVADVTLQSSCHSEDESVLKLFSAVYRTAETVDWLASWCAFGVCKRSLRLKCMAITDHPIREKEEEEVSLV
ncbi:hypothetical protein J6590_010794 [Homalodisca vitripennis]|nr:hypothetical protein J6590_010794 [Homalodisca vitripennis]